jgi:copper(I)-binding protein
MTMYRLLPLFFVLLPSIALAELEINNAWIKNLPATVPVRAGYMSLYNPDSREISILSITSEKFASVQIHQTIEEDGIMRMEHVPVLKIGPGARLILEPGGFHLMMMQPQQETEPGDEIEIWISFDDGSEQNLMMTVRK